MAINTYAKLQAAVQDELNRNAGLLGQDVTIGSTTIEGKVKRAIANCEVRVRQLIRVRQQETSTTIAFTNGTTEYALPSDFKSARLMHLVQDPIVTIEQDSLENLISEYPSNATGEPRKFAIVGSNFQVRPIPDSGRSAKLYYYQDLTSLSDTNTSNWLLLECPNIYLYGSCLELTPYLGDDERIQVWKGAFDEAIGLLTGDDNATKWNGVLVQSALPVMIVV